MAQTTTIDCKKDSTTNTRYSPLVNELPIYYGWVIMVAAIIGRIMTSPGRASPHHTPAEKRGSCCGRDWHLVARLLGCSE